MISQIYRDTALFGGLAALHCLELYIFTTLSAAYAPPHTHTHRAWLPKLPHGECFLALGFELQTVELCSTVRVRECCGGCAQHTPLVPN